MREQTQFFMTLTVIVLLLSGCAFLHFVCQNLYHKGQIVLQDERIYNSVIGRYFTFDSMILGTSMSENFRCSDFDRITGGYSQKLTTSGGHISEIAFTAKYAIKYNQIKVALIDLLIDSCVMSEPRYKIPKDLYADSQSMLPSVLRAWSLEGLLNNSISFFFKRNTFDRDKNYAWGDSWSFGKEPLAKYIFQNNAINLRKERLASVDLEVMKYNAKEYLKTLVANNPDITFYLFFAPHHITEYLCSPEVYRAYRKVIFDTVLEMRNVKLYDFASVEEITCNSGNYKDLLHYSPDISHWIIQQLKHEKYLVAKNNREEFEQNFDKLINSFDQQKALDELKAYYKR